MAEKNALPLPATIAQATPRARAGLWALASYLLVGVSALVPRAMDLGRFITDDEANFWLRRSDVFLNALRSGDYIQTAITTHPGVTTMWLGASGIVLRHALLDWGVLRSDAFPVVLALMRLPGVLIHVAVLLLCYGLLRRMLAPLLALLAALLWAADPFIVGYSRLLHTDALAMSFAALSLLAACYAWNHARAESRFGVRWGALALSGVAAGLAFLSKSPALAVAPAVGLVALLCAIAQDDGRRKADEGRLAHTAIGYRPSSIVPPLAAWLALAVLTVFALWPALWVSPVEAYRQVQLGVTAEGAQPHMLGNFFLGRQDDAPGLLYYPVALPLRLTPWTLLGLLALPLIWRRAGWSPSQRRDLAALAGFTVLFLAAMSVFPKKFDRYLVPAFPAIDILAAAGLIGLGAWGLEPRARSTQDGGRTTVSVSSPVHLLSKPWIYFVQPVLVGTIALVALVNVAWWQPYQIVAFNQLFGGTAAGARTFFMGWGEGLEQAADWLNQQPDITGVRVVSLRVTSISPYLKEGAQVMFPKGDQLRDRTGYVVVYLPQVQAGAPGVPFDQFYGRVAPLHVVSIHGVPFVWIYRAPPQVSERRPAGFGETIRLYGLSQDAQWRRGQPTRLRLVWSAAARPPTDYWMFAHIVGPDGQRYAQLDLPLATSQWSADRFAETELPLALPANAPAGEYRVLIGLYAPETGQRLALAPDDPRDAAPDSPDALILTRFELK